MPQVKFNFRKLSKSGVTESFEYESAFVINVNWNAGNGEWNVNTWQRDDNEWNAGKRVFSPETNHFLPP